MSAPTPGRESLHRKGVAPPPLVCLSSQPGSENLLAAAVLCLTDCISTHTQRRAGFVVGQLRRAENIRAPSPAGAEPRGAGASFCCWQIHTAPSWATRSAGCSPSVPEKPPSCWRWVPAQQETFLGGSPAQRHEHLPPGCKSPSVGALSLLSAVTP